MKLKTNPLSVLKINEIAQQFRKDNLVDNDSYFPVLEIVDNLFSKGKLEYVILDNDNPLFKDNELSFYNKNENRIYFKEAVIEEYEEQNYRSNFTIAHELFHYVQSQILNFKFEEVEECKTYEDAEWQANEFAGALLIPYEKINDNPEELSSKYHVTMECALVRILYKKKREKLKK